MHCLALLIIDLLSIVASSVTAAILCNDLRVSPELLLRTQPYLLLTTLAAVPVFVAAGLNRSLWRFTSLSDCVRIAAAVFVTIVLAVALAHASNRLDGVAPSLPIVQGLLMMCSLVGIRAAMRLRHAIRQRKHNPGAPATAARESVLVVGITAAAEFFLRSVAESGTECTVAGLLSTVGRHRGRLLRSYPVLGCPEELETVLQDLEVHGVHIDRIVVATKFNGLPQSARDTLLRVCAKQNIQLDVFDGTFGLGDARPPSPQASSRASANNTAEKSTPAMLDFGQLASRPYLKWKSVLDCALAIFCIIALAPLMLLVGLIVLLDVGYPPIFWQQRPGALGRPIKVLKFRTMGPARDKSGRHLADAERSSVVGRFLRRARLDELPQVYNVLFGQMSLVGPRPLLPADQSPGATARLRLRPGLTGWAQINGGRHLSIDDKAALDLWYVKHASFGLDLAILLSTARTIVFGERIDRRAVREAWRELGYEQPGVLAVPEMSPATPKSGRSAHAMPTTKSGHFGRGSGNPEPAAISPSR